MESKKKAKNPRPKKFLSFLFESHPFLSSPIYLIAGFLLIRRFPTRLDWFFPVLNWTLAVLVVFLWYFAFRGERIKCKLAAWVVFILLLQGSVLYYDSQIRTFLSIEWPTTEVPSNEAVVGGSLRNIDAANSVLKIYVCVVSADRAACFLDQHANAPSIRERYWHGLVRLGNEHPDNDHGNPKYFIVVAAVAVDQLSQLPGISEPLPNSASELVNQLSKVKTRAIAGPFPISKRYGGDPKIQFTTIEEQNTQRRISLPQLRAPNYAVCPPVKIMWKGPEQGQSAAAVEAWQDGRLHGSAESAFSYCIDKWPENVERIEVKISSARGKGPYDSITLKRRVRH